MKPADICIAALVAVIWGLAFVASRIALVAGIAVMLLSKRTQALPKAVGA